MGETLRTYTYETAENRINRRIDELFFDQNVKEDFPEEVLSMGDACPRETNAIERRDLRSMPCLTIDCADTKDMDDAVSISRIGDEGYLLGVHIADVGTYVTPGSALDDVAITRGTSIYLPGRTVPMLPAFLSDGLCSLNPNEKKNTVTVMIMLSQDGTVEDFEIFRSIIESRVKGCYNEVNALFADEATPEVLHKYRDVNDDLFTMLELSEKLKEQRAAAGACIEQEKKIEARIVDGEIELVSEEEGRAERLIQEFIVLTNRLVSQYLASCGLPVIQRVHKARGRKAFYSCREAGHIGLALDGYVHFTSPIRRLADLKIHQMISMHLSGVDAASIWEAFGNDLEELCDIATRRERRADDITKNILKACEKEYFVVRRNETFIGTAAGLTRDGKRLFELDGLHVLLPSFAPINARPGTRYSFMVDIGYQSGCLGLYRMRRLAAA